MKIPQANESSRETNKSRSSYLYPSSTSFPTSPQRYNTSLNNPPSSRLPLIIPYPLPPRSINLIPVGIIQIFILEIVLPHWLTQANLNTFEGVKEGNTRRVGSVDIEVPRETGMVDTCIERVVQRRSGFDQRGRYISKYKVARWEVKVKDD